MGASSAKEGVIDYWITDDIQTEFFSKTQVDECLKEFFSKSLSVDIEIGLEKPPIQISWSTTKLFYRIQLIGEYKERPNVQEKFYDLLNQFLKKMQLKVYEPNDKVVEWLHSYKMTGRRLNLLQTLFNKEFDDVISIFTLRTNGLNVYYLPKRPFSTVNAEKLMYFIENEIIQEIIPLPTSFAQSSKMAEELEKIINGEEEDNQNKEDTENEEDEEDDGDGEVIVKFNKTSSQAKQQEIILYGYCEKVTEIKRKILNLTEKYTLIPYKLNPKHKYQIESFVACHRNPLQKLERWYQDYGVQLRLESHEFSAPQHLKEDIESNIEEILSESSTAKTFQTIELFKDIAIKEEQYLNNIAERCRCYIKTELKHNCQSYLVPTASITKKQVSKSIIEQSKLFCSSTNVFKRMTVANGSIELRTGDIALQNVDTIIISTTYNGLKEGVIERLGEIDNEITHLEIDGTMYTEINGGKLNCKRVLFSNWLPTLLISNDGVLRLSIQTFVSKCIQYTIQHQNTKSIAFAVPDTCTNESILAEEMITEVKRQLATNQLELKISFVCLPEQEPLYEQFSNLFPTTEDAFIYFDHPSTIKLTCPNDIFQFWDQHTINSFFKYCKDRWVLPKLTEEKIEIELSGSPHGIAAIKKKFHLLSELIKRTTNHTLTMERPSSAVSFSARSDISKTGIAMAKLYNIVISYSQKDQRKCRRLINRLTEEGFSISTDLNSADKQSDLYSQMEKSDCIILCISENYYNNLSCIQEAKHAFQTDKKVFLVKIENIPLLGWDNDLFEGKLFFQSFGSENYFDLEYGRLLLELLRYTKPGFTSLLQRRVSCSIQNSDDFRRMLTDEQKSFIENTAIQKSSKPKLPEIMSSKGKLQNQSINISKSESASNSCVNASVFKLCNDGSNPCKLDGLGLPNSYFLPINGYHCLETFDGNIICTCPDKSITRNRPCRICDRVPHPCGSGSSVVTCHDLNQSFSCICRDKQGEYVLSDEPCDENVVIPSNEIKCTNGGIRDPETNKCYCPSGFTGSHCETRADGQLCDRIQCMSAGICAVRPLFNGSKIYQSKCLCRLGFDGDYCEIPSKIGSCTASYCLHGGSCNQRTIGSEDYIYCQCKPGWSGSRCDKQYFRCRSSGYFIDEQMKNQGKFFSCTSLEDDYFLQQLSCPKGLKFNLEKELCLP
ncbi:unnamed protein product [Rotaria sp. Silwood1]|nr:unnamed protein product [Rotaria sp. Silwood1]